MTLASGTKLGRYELREQLGAGGMGEVYQCAKILDFGLAKLIETRQENVAQTDVPTRQLQTDPGVIMGTVGYMSPEQVRGIAIDHRSDIFSFGAVLYEMMSGQRAFQRDIETLNAILKEEPLELTQTNSNITPSMERIASAVSRKKIQNAVSSR